MIERYAISGRLVITGSGAGGSEAAGLEGLEEGLSLREACDRFEQAYIQRALSKYSGSVAKAAEQLGIHRSLLYKKLKKGTE